MPRLFQALRDLSESTLATRNCRLLASGDGTVRSLIAPDSRGGVTHLGGAVVSLHVGVVASPEECRSLARRKLGASRVEPPTEGEVRGAMCDLSYLLAGAVCRRLHGFGDVSVGQPSFMAGRMELSSGWRLKEMTADVDGIVLTVLCATRNDAVFAAVTHGALT